LNATAEMNLGRKYNIMDVTFSDACRTGTNSKSIAFDHLGRPLRGALKDYTDPYENTTITKFVTLPSQCQITLCSVSSCSTATSDEKVTIAIEPESGYAHIID